MSNYSENRKAVDRFRKEMEAMLGDISKIDKKVLNHAVNNGVAYAKKKSPVLTGFYRKNWNKSGIVKRNECVEARLFNRASYASYVNYGHRTVDGYGNTTGYVKSKQGDHLLEKTVEYMDKRMVKLFAQEVEEVKKKHDK